MEDLRQTEVAKLTATFLNGIALAVAVGTVIGPGMLWLSGQGAVIAAGVGILLAAALHLTARRAMRRRKDCWRD